MKPANTFKYIVMKDNIETAVAGETARKCRSEYALNTRKREEAYANEQDESPFLM